MPYNCNLIIDSCCDLPYEAVNREGVYLVRFPFTLDGREYLDDMWHTMNMSKFYDCMRDGGQPTTSQASAIELRNAYESAAKSGIPTIYLSFSSGLSSHFESACMVLDEVRAEYPDADLRIVDTLAASVEEGLIIHEALCQQERGLTIDEMEAWALEARHFANVYFMVDDLESLRRGGRIPQAVAFVGSKLDVKPILTVGADGKLSMCGVARGRKKGLKVLAKQFVERSDKNRPKLCCIGHADSEKDLNRLEELIVTDGYGPLFVEHAIGPVIGTHVGPGMVAIGFWGRDRRENNA